MIFLAPHFLWIGFALSAITIAIHFIVTRQPPSELFPTARFVPESAVEAVSKATHPTDLLLLLLRVLAIFGIAAAFAGPVFEPERSSLARIILADVSGSSNLDEVRESARTIFRKNDVLIAFDTSARVAVSPDSLQPARSLVRTASLSSGLIAALRSAPKLRERSDSISLVVISAFPSGSWDAATDTIRSLWPGSIRTVRTGLTRDSSMSVTTPVELRGRTDDPARYSVALASRVPHASGVIVLRSGNVDDVRAQATILHWPETERPLFAHGIRPANHTALVVDSVVVVAKFTTVWEFSADSVRDAEVIARWEDGSPAALERKSSAGCLRSAAIPMPSKGDLAVRPDFVAAVRKLLSHCGNSDKLVALNEQQMTRLKGGFAAAPGAAFAAIPDTRSPHTLWLLLAALLLLGVEQVVRRAGHHKPKTPETVPERFAA